MTIEFIQFRLGWTVRRAMDYLRANANDSEMISNCFVVDERRHLQGIVELRQLILAGSGNGDSAVTVFGMMAGAAIAHNFGLAGSADSVNEAGQYVVGGIQTNGQMAVLIALAALLVISLVHLPKKEH